MNTTEILNVINEINAPWSIRFERDGTEDVAILQDANGDELATSRPFWLPEGDDPIPSTLAAMRLMEAAPALSEILETLLDQIRNLKGESSVIDEGLMQGEAFKEAVSILARLERRETNRPSETHDQAGDPDNSLSTPGPWEDCGSGLIYGQCPEGDDDARFVADVCSDPDTYTGREQANARLIVAAPKMVRVLKLALKALNTAPRFRVGETNSYAIASEIERTLSEALGDGRTG